MIPEDEPFEKPPMFNSWSTVYGLVLCLLAVYVALMTLFRVTFS